MPRFHPVVLGVIASLFLTSPATAQSFGVSLGAHTTGAAGGAASIGLEYRAAPHALRGDWTGGWLVAARTNDLGDAWLGLGYGLLHPLGGGWHVEGSFAAGLYHAGATAMGHPLEFRTQIGLGYALSERTHLLLSVEHLSNGGLGAINPGTNLVSLGLRHAF